MPVSVFILGIDRVGNGKDRTFRKFLFQPALGFRRLGPFLFRLGPLCFRVSPRLFGFRPFLFRLRLLGFRISPVFFGFCVLCL